MLRPEPEPLRAASLIVVRARLRRRALVRWLVALGLALLSVVGVARERSSARADQERWGTTIEVAVVARSIGAGTMLSGDDVRWVAVPAGVVPAGALTRADPIPAGRARVDLVAGEMLLAARVVADRGEVASMLPPDTVAVGIARYDDPLPLAVGDRVDVIEVSDDSEAAVLVRGALVVAVDESGATVAVPVPARRAVASAAARGSLVLALSG